MEHSQDGMEIRLNITEDEWTDEPCRPLTEAIRAIRRELKLQRERLEKLVTRMDSLERPAAGERHPPDGAGESERAFACALTRAIDEFTCALERFQSALSGAKAKKPAPSRGARAAAARRLYSAAPAPYVRHKPGQATLRVRAAAAKSALEPRLVLADAQKDAPRPAVGMEDAAVLDTLSEARTAGHPAGDIKAEAVTGRISESGGLRGAAIPETEVFSSANEPLEETGQHLPPEPVGSVAVSESAGAPDRLAAGAKRLRDIAGGTSAAAL